MIGEGCQYPAANILLPVGRMSGIFDQSGTNRYLSPRRSDLAQDAASMSVFAAGQFWTVRLKQQDAGWKCCSFMPAAASALGSHTDEQAATTLVLEFDRHSSNPGSESPARISLVSQRQTERPCSCDLNLNRCIEGS